MSFSDRVIRVKKEPDALLSEIERGGDPYAIAADILDIGNRSLRMVDISIPRASGLKDDCMRQKVLGTFLMKKVREFDSFKSRLTFGIGTAVHYWAQNSDELFGDARRGWWRCLACGKTRYFGAPPIIPCKCGAHQRATVYQEHELRIHEPVHVSGHADMFFERRKGIFRVVELKTLAGDQFEGLRSPMVEHEWQVLTYMEYLQHDPTFPMQVDSKVGYVIYVSKKAHSNLFPMKAWPVQANRLVMREIRSKLMEYKRGREEYPKHLPAPASACRNSRYLNYAAKTCPVLNECKGHKEDLRGQR